MSQTLQPHSAGVKQVCIVLLTLLTFSPAISQTNIFTTQTPIAGTDNDHQPTVGQELGVKFTSTAAGTITGIRFYKTSGNTGTHTGELYASNGTRIAQATFANETANGWQTVLFSSPLTIAANTSYTAAYFSSLGNYTEDNDYFRGNTVTNAPLTAPSDGTNGGNGTDPGNGQGVYAYTASPAFPNQLYKSANYWVDVIFNSGSAVVANAGTAQTYPYPIGSITLNGSNSTGNITSYLWTQVSGPNVSVIESPTSVSTNVSGLADGVYIFNLSVNGGASNAKVTITRKTPPPVANIGGNATIIAPISVIELGSVQDQGIFSGIVTGVSWTTVSGPNQPVIKRTGGTRVDISGLIQGIYILQLKETGPGGSDSARVTVNVLPPDLSPNIFTSQIPSVGNTNAGQGIEVGVKFMTTVPGYITGIRFFKSSGNSGTHTGELYSSDGTRLAQAVFTNETASGWQTVTFNSPVAILDNVIYVAAYFSSAGNYTGSPNYFTDYVTNNPLSALSDNNNPPNGVYIKTSTPAFPSSSDGNKENYWVDVVYSNGTSSVKANAGTNQIIVSTTTSVSGSGSTGTITSYLWTMISGPNGVAPVITTPSSVSTTITGLKATSGPFGEDYSYYVFQLSVNGGQSVSRMTIHVSDISVNLSSPQTVTYPNSSATLDATVTTGTDNTYLWTLSSGPNKPTITSPNSISTTVNGLILGNYEFRLTLNGKYNYYLDVFVVPEVDSIFTSQVPPQTTSNDGKSIEVGMKFRSSKSGFINGIRFYKASGNIGIHIGELYSSTGVILAHATFTNETTSGWQTVSFIPSVAISAGVTYLVSYFSNAGYYSATPNYFTAGITNGALTALADGTDGANGVFGYSNTPTFPSNVGNKTNYWVDAVFSTISNSPIANAGNNQVINLPSNSTILYGTASTGIISSYLWTQISGPNTASINNATNVYFIPSGLILGKYVFQLSVNGGASTSQVSVEVDPALTPMSNAGPNQIVYLPNTTFTLDGTASTGNITNYKWKQISGDNALLIANPFNSTTTVSGLVPGVYNFTLTINDGASVSQVTITVNPAPSPVANAGTNQAITLPVTSTSLNGSGSAGTITGYTWSEISGPNTAQFSSVNDVSPTVSGLVQGTYVFQLSLKGGTTASQVTVNVLAGNIVGKNIFTTQVPVAKTDNDHQASVGFEAGVKFSSSLAGTITGIRFYKTTGNSGTHTGELYSSAGTRLAQATFTGETATGWQTVTFASPVAIAANATYVAAYFSSLGNYVEDNGYFAAAVVNSPLTALADGTDGGNAPFKYASSPSFPDQNYMKANYWVDVVFVSGTTPVANAGFNQTINLPNSTATLNGSSSTGANSYNWTTVSGPNSPGITTPTNVSTAVSGLVQGTYIFKLSVNGGVTSAQVTVIVNGPLPPVANAGADQTVQIPAPLLLNAIGSTGIITSYLWTEITGPNSVGFDNPTGVTTKVTGVVAGIYVFQVSLNGGVSISKVNVTVLAPVPASANAGPDQFLVLPNSTVTLDGSRSSGYITDYTWVLTGYTPGAPVPTITTPNSVVTTVSGLGVGTYTFNLRLNGQQSVSAITVYVTATVPPIANAGIDQSINWPASSVTLDGSGSTGSITSYTWEYSGGINIYTTPVIKSPNSVSTVVTGLGTGVYYFRLRLNNEDFGTSQVSITVNPDPGIGMNIFTTQTPVAKTDNDHTSLIGQEVGVKFKTSLAGYITGMRFYKTAGNTGPHTGELYSSTGVRLAQAEFNYETETGWQYVTFPNPILISANTTYTVAYFSSLGNYTEDNDYFLHHSVTNTPLNAPEDGTNGGNGTDPGSGQGVYKYSSSPVFPNQLYRSANYWVDVIFNPAPAVTAAPILSENAKAFDEVVTDSFLKDSYSLGQNYPNPVPMSQNTKIEYSVPISTQVSLVLYDIQGKPVKMMVNEMKNAGKYFYDLNTGNLAKGLYIYSMHAGNFYDVKKLVVQ